MVSVTHVGTMLHIQHSHSHLLLHVGQSHSSCSWHVECIVESAVSFRVDHLVKDCNGFSTMMVSIGSHFSVEGHKERISQRQRRIYCIIRNVFQSIMLLQATDEQREKIKISTDRFLIFRTISTRCAVHMVQRKTCSTK